MISTTVLVIGAGFSGICLGAKLRESDIPFIILEKAQEVGGTWRDNTYPGAACDTESHLYSYSFRPNPHWSRKFAEQPEILDYLKNCAAEFGIRKHIRFGAEVSSARFDEAGGRWIVEIADGEIIAAQFLVSAVGQLNRPSQPHIEGLETFKGGILHTARWDETCNLTGQTVAVIGTGASAVQLIPRIVKDVKRLVVFQRSPNWITAKGDRPYTAGELGWFRRVPLLTWLHRQFFYWRCEKSWPEFVNESKAARKAERNNLGILESGVGQATLREKLTPRYSIGCKRVLLTDDYYPALQQSNVELVTDSVRRIEGNTVVTESGQRHPVDMLVFATGFRATEFLAPMAITGRDGRDLHDIWKNGAEAYLGITVANFPNFFMLYGPNTNLGHSSIIFMIECQVNYVVKCLKAVRRLGRNTIEVKEEIMRAFIGRLGTALQRMAWVASCSNWYKLASGRVVNNWSGTTSWYWWRTRKPKLAEYRLD
ncbi:MAG TPA: NAD(P)/FAD-dependent oxidoreductase [Dongiaceae bacterium]